MVRKKTITLNLRTRGEKLCLRYNPNGDIRESVRVSHIARGGRVLGELSLSYHAADALRRMLSVVELAGDLCI